MRSAVILRLMMSMMLLPAPIRAVAPYVVQWFVTVLGGCRVNFGK